MTSAGAVFGSRVRCVKLLILVLFVSSALFGCASTKKKVGPIFFPPPPDEPRVQFLTGVTSSADLGAQQTGVAKLLVGGTETVTKLSKPYGITYKKGKVYVCDIGASQVVVIDFVKQTMQNLNEAVGPAELKKPISVAVDDDGNVYVADTGRKDIAVYDAEGKYLKSFGKQLSQTGLIAVEVYKDFLLTLDNHQGLIFILDRKTGELLTTIGNNPDKTKNLAMANGMTVDQKGNIHVVNMGNGSVKEYDLDGNLLSSFGRLGDSPGEFTRPRGITVDQDGNIFVVDAGHQVVQVFNDQRRILGFFGQPGLLAGSTNLPAGVATTKENLELFQKMAAPGFKLTEVVFVTNQFQSVINSALAVYGLGEMETKEPKSKAKPTEPKGADGAKPAK